MKNANLQQYNDSNSTLDNYSTVLQGIASRHYKEFEKSKIHSDIVRLANRSRSEADSLDWVDNHRIYLRAVQDVIDGKISPDDLEAHVEALGLEHERKKRRNDGRLRDSELKKYERLHNPDRPPFTGYQSAGWWCAPRLDLIGLPESRSICFKPDFAETDKENKVRKYLFPWGLESKKNLPQYGLSPAPFITPVTHRIARKIARRNGKLKEYGAYLQSCLGLKNQPIRDFLRSEDAGFWLWALDQKIPIVLTEGVKKAQSLISQGFLAVAAPSITLVVRSQDEYGNPLLQPELRPEYKILFRNKPDIYIAFDQDTKPKTRRAVCREIGKITACIQRELRSKDDEKLDVKVLCWSRETKGIDDYIAARIDKNCINPVEELIENALDASFYLNREEWLKLLKFTPNMCINQDYLDKGVFETILNNNENVVLAIKSPTGTGKTTALIDYLKSNLLYGYVYKCGYRNSTELQFNTKSGFLHLIFDTGADEYNLNSDSMWVSSCINSLWKIPEQKYSELTLVIDEIDSVLKVLQDESAVSPRTREKFHTMLAECRNIILISGTLADVHCEYIQKYSEKKLIKIENVTKKPRPKVHNFLGTFRVNKEDELTLARTQKLPLVMKALDEVKVNPIFVNSDSRKFTKTFKELALSHGIKESEILLINAETHSDERVTAFLNNPDATIERFNLRLIIASPTVEAGLDVALRDYFSSDYHFYFGVLDSDAIAQKLIRIRDTKCQRYLWVNPISLNPFRDDWYSPFNRLKSASIGLELFNREILSNDEHHQLLVEENAKIQRSPFGYLIYQFCRRNALEGFQFREFVCENLKLQGYQIEPFSATEDGKIKAFVDEFKCVAAAVHDDEVQTFLDAAPDKIMVHGKPVESLGDEQIHNIDQTNLTLEQRYAIKREKLNRTFPVQDLWSKDFCDFLLKNPRSLWLWQRLATLLKAPDTIKKREFSRYQSTLDRLLGVPTDSPAIGELTRFGIAESIAFNNVVKPVIEHWLEFEKDSEGVVTPRWWFTKDDPVIVTALKMARTPIKLGKMPLPKETTTTHTRRAKQTIMADLLQISLPSDPIKAVRKILNKYGLDLEGQKIDDGFKREYRIVPMCTSEHRHFFSTIFEKILAHLESADFECQKTPKDNQDKDYTDGTFDDFVYKKDTPKVPAQNTPIVLEKSCDNVLEKSDQENPIMTEKTEQMTEQMTENPKELPESAWRVGEFYELIDGINELRNRLGYPDREWAEWKVKYFRTATLEWMSIAQLRQIHDLLSQWAKEAG